MQYNEIKSAIIKNLYVKLCKVKKNLSNATKPGIWQFRLQKPRKNVRLEEFWAKITKKPGILIQFSHFK